MRRGRGTLEIVMAMLRLRMDLADLRLLGLQLIGLGARETAEPGPG